MRFAKTLKDSALVLSAAAIAACGGGGGAEFTPPQTSTPLAITAANGQSAAYAAWESANGSAGLTDLLGSSGFVSTGQLKPTVLPTTDFGNIVNKIPFGPIPCPARYRARSRCPAIWPTRLRRR